MEAMTPQEIAENIGLEVQQWHGKCYLVVFQMLNLDIIEGDIATGFYHRGEYVTDHCWIKLPDGRICDPTRWTLDGRKPHIYIGKLTPAYDLDGKRWGKELEKMGKEVRNALNAAAEFAKLLNEEWKNES